MKFRVGCGGGDPGITPRVGSRVGVQRARFKKNRWVLKLGEKG